MRLLVFVITFVASQMTLAQQPMFHPDVANDKIQPWTSAEIQNDPSNFQFAIVSDRTGGMRPGVFAKGAEKLNLLRPEFVMSVGDLIQGYTEDREQLKREWDEFDGIVRSLKMPFFYVPGNHDITNQVMENVWQERLGDTYYSFVYHDVLFLCLNSEDQKRGAGRGTISDDQYAWIEKTLGAHDDVRWTLIFMHQPMWVQQNPERWPDVEKLLANRKHTVFTGHYHSYTRYQRNNGKYFVLATTGGGSGLRGPQFGEFDHVVWVTMTDEGPIISNLMLDGIEDEYVRTSDQKAFVEDLLSSRAINISTPYIDNYDQKSLTIPVRMTNDQDVPMRVVVSEKFGWDIVSAAAESTYTIPPNSVVNTALTIRPRRESWSYYSEPVPVQFFITYETEPVGELEIPVMYYIKPLPKRTVGFIDKQVIVDGNLDEWPELTYSWQGEGSDNSGSWDIRMDDYNVYIAAHITDDSLMVDANETVWNQDCISVGIDLRDPAVSAQQRWPQYTLRITPATEHVQSQVYRPERLPESWMYAANKSEDGYGMEVVIPISEIHKHQPEPWRGMRINLFFDDLDTKGSNIPRIHYDIPWRDEGSALGSGLFWNPNN